MANEELLQALLMISLYFLSFAFRFLDGWWRRNFHYPSTQGKIIIIISPSHDSIKVRNLF